MGDEKLTIERKIQLLLEAQLDIYSTRLAPAEGKPPVPLTDEDLAHLERIARISKILKMKAELGVDAATAAQKVNAQDLLAELRKSKDPEMFAVRGRPKGPRPKVGDDAPTEG